MKPVTKTVTIILSAITIFMGCWIFLNPKFQQNRKPELKIASYINSTVPLSANFSLTDTDEKPFNLNAMRGKWTVLFFGYATCPTICPQTLSIVKDTWKELDKGTAEFVFVSLNPEKDTTKNLRTFLKRFHHGFKGVTGNKKQMEKLSKQMNVFATQTEENGVIDHSATLTLIDPKGQIKAMFTPPFTSNEVAHDIKSIIRN